MKGLKWIKLILKNEQEFENVLERIQHSESILANYNQNSYFKENKQELS